MYNLQEIRDTYQPNLDKRDFLETFSRFCKLCLFISIWWIYKLIFFFNGRDIISLNNKFDWCKMKIINVKKILKERKWKKI